jgi:hypothetical protein
MRLKVEFSVDVWYQRQNQPAEDLHEEGVVEIVIDAVLVFKMHGEEGAEVHDCKFGDNLKGVVSISCKYWQKEALVPERTLALIILWI